MAPRPETHQPLGGMRILVVEDEFLISMMIEDTFVDAGADVVAAANVADALRIARSQPLSAALLDVRLGNQTTEPVADLLAERGVPFFFYTGQPLPDGVKAKHPNARAWSKPTSIDMFVGEFAKLARGGQANDDVYSEKTLRAG